MATTTTNVSALLKQGETVDEALKRMMAENAALKAEQKQQDKTLGNVPETIEFGIGANGKSLGTCLAPKHTFQTGSKGFKGFGKYVIAGELYQVQVQAVKIHSKPTK